MKELTDEEIQGMLDRGITPDPTHFSETSKKAMDAYRLLFDTLDHPSPVDLSPAFASKVSTIIQARKNRYSDIKLFVFVALIIIALGIACALYLSNGNGLAALDLSPAILKFKYPLLFAVFMLAVVQYTEFRTGIHRMEGGRYTG